MRAIFEAEHNSSFHRQRIISNGNVEKNFILKYKKNLLEQLVRFKNIPISYKDLQRIKTLET